MRTCLGGVVRSAIENRKLGPLSVPVSVFIAPGSLLKLRRSPDMRHSLISVSKCLWPLGPQHSLLTHKSSPGLMCESAVVLESAEGTETVMPEAAMVWVKGSDIVCVDILGREMAVNNARISEIDLMGHRVLLTRL